MFKYFVTALALLTAPAQASSFSFTGIDTILLEDPFTPAQAARVDGTFSFGVPQTFGVGLFGNTFGRFIDLNLTVFDATNIVIGNITAMNGSAAIQTGVSKNTIRIDGFTNYSGLPGPYNLGPLTFEMDNQPSYLSWNPARLFSLIFRVSIPLAVLFTARALYSFAMG
ncbi:MAG: hypothetical protein AAF607_12420 [Pseudomonadota bacterium]